MIRRLVGPHEQCRRLRYKCDIYLRRDGQQCKQGTHVNQWHIRALFMQHLLDRVQSCRGAALVLSCSPYLTLMQEARRKRGTLLVLVLNVGPFEMTGITVVLKMRVYIATSRTPRWQTTFGGPTSRVLDASCKITSIRLLRSRPLCMHMTRACPTLVTQCCC